MIGLDDSTELFTVLYADARNVFRVYQMDLREDVWTQWRDDPGFRQRFEGTFSPDGRTVSAHWEKSVDGAAWEHDFDITYTKVRL